MSSTAPEENDGAHRTPSQPLELVVSPRRRGRGAVRWLSRVFVTLFTLIVLAVAVPSAFGLSHSTMTDDSMSGSMDQGSVVFTKPRSVMDLQIGDVITYRLPSVVDGGEGQQITRRIADIELGEIWTSSDRTGAVDPWTITPGEATQERAVADVPYLGYLYDAVGGGADLARKVFSVLP